MPKNRVYQHSTVESIEFPSYDSSDIAATDG